MEHRLACDCLRPRPDVPAEFCTCVITAASDADTAPPSTSQGPSRQRNVTHCPLAELIYPSTQRRLGPSELIKSQGTHFGRIDSDISFPVKCPPSAPFAVKCASRLQR
ncbi:uncharacterized protein LOC117643302 isoform X3 [Thrips palmi]|uniref:Uncharacterized protein LOC117643302 isoform X3 n=1 Tax=Thrips palmi TaxID=161013 RepID=A0A6P8YE89_THRPL|nr:uncharacterized protein LOC117643302 isoform X3 [Thrips palmi]